MMRALICCGLLLSLACSESDATDVTPDVGVADVLADAPRVDGGRDVSPADVGALDVGGRVDLGASADMGGGRDVGVDARPMDAAVDAAPVMDAAVEPDARAPDAGWPRTLVYVGAGSWGGQRGTIFVYEMDARGQYRAVGPQNAGQLVSFLAVDGARRRVHVADEGGAQLHSFEIRADARLSPMGTVGAPAGPVYVTPDRTGAWILSASYGGGQIASYSTRIGGVDRQVDIERSGAQSHSVVVSLDNRFVYAASKGEDQIAQYAFDANTGALEGLGVIRAAPGAGPRHLAFHPDGQILYLINESNGTLIVYDRDPGTGQLTQRTVVSSLPVGFAGAATGADLHLTPNGRFLYFTLRVSGADGLIGCFDVGADGALSNPRFESSRGRTPRNFDVDPTGTYLSVANRESSQIVVFRIEPTGALTPVEEVNLDETPFFVGSTTL